MAVSRALKKYEIQLKALGDEYVQKVLELSREYIAKNQMILDEAYPQLDEWEREMKMLDSDSSIGFIIQVMDEYFQDGFYDEYHKVEDNAPCG